jgi:putative transposase
MRENGFDPGPKRGEKTWDEFLKMHAATLWQCDFFAHKVLTLRGVREFFVIAFLHVWWAMGVISVSRIFYPVRGS